MENMLTNSSSLTTYKKFHACRLYLQVTFRSGLANLKGDSLCATSVQRIKVKK